jgi:hypothetical protein
MLTTKTLEFMRAHLETERPDLPMSRKVNYPLRGPLVVTSVQSIVNHESYRNLPAKPVQDHRASCHSPFLVNIASLREKNQTSGMPSGFFAIYQEKASRKEVQFGRYLHSKGENQFH